MILTWWVGGSAKGGRKRGPLALVLLLLSLQPHYKVEGVNIVSPFSFNVLVVPIKLPVQIGSSLGSLVALGALVVAKLALLSTAKMNDDLGESYHVYQPTGEPWKGHAKERVRRTILAPSGGSPQLLFGLEAREQMLLESMDQSHRTRTCLRKFLCRLGSEPEPSRLDLEQQLILTYFQQGIHQQPRAALSDFRKAVHFGISQRHGQPQACSKFYPDCPFTSQQMLEFYKVLRKSTPGKGT